MKIVNVMLGRGLGGIEQALLDYCEASALAGHPVMAIIDPHAAIRPELERRGVSYMTLSNLGAWDPIAIYKLRQMLKKLEPDACIAHGNRALSLLMHASPELRIAVPMHNFKIKTQDVKHVFHPTQRLRDFVEAQGGVPKQYYDVPNMVRVPEQFPVRQWRKPPVIGAMGRFVAKKGFDLYLNALAELKTRGIAFTAVLAGSGEEDEGLKTLALRKGLNDIVHFPGWVEDKSRFFDAVDIFCLPSHHEPFGIVLLEAMAAGLPVVSTASEGPSEILADGENGVVVPLNDPLKLADALSDMVTMRPRAELLARNAFTRVRETYDLPVVAKKLDLALYSLCRV